jgi:hypothetical protein
LRTRALILVLILWLPAAAQDKPARQTSAIDSKPMLVFSSYWRYAGWKAVAADPSGNVILAGLPIFSGNYTPPK